MAARDLFRGSALVRRRERALGYKGGAHALSCECHPRRSVRIRKKPHP